MLIIDELGYVPLSQTGAELMFEVFSQRYERGSIIVTSNPPFDKWTGVFGSERPTVSVRRRDLTRASSLRRRGYRCVLSVDGVMSRRASTVVLRYRADVRRTRSQPRDVIVIAFARGKQVALEELAGRTVQNIRS